MKWGLGSGWDDSLLGLKWALGRCGQCPCPGCLRVCIFLHILFIFTLWFGSLIWCSVFPSRVWVLLDCFCFSLDSGRWSPFLRIRVLLHTLHFSCFQSYNVQWSFFYWIRLAVCVLLHKLNVSTLFFPKSWLVVCFLAVAQFWDILRGWFSHPVVLIQAFTLKSPRWKLCCDSPPGLKVFCIVLCCKGALVLLRYTGGGWSLSRGCVYFPPPAAGDVSNHTPSSKRLKGFYLLSVSDSLSHNNRRDACTRQVLDLHPRAAGGRTGAGSAIW